MLSYTIISFSFCFFVLCRSPFFSFFFFFNDTATTEIYTLSLHDALPICGAYGHSWFVDRAQELSVVAFTNTLYEGMSGRFVNDLRDAVYGVCEVQGASGAPQ